MKPINHSMMAAYQPGDRVQVQSTVTTPIPMPGNTGTVLEVVPSYADNTVGYNIHIDGDARSSRVWFFLEHQLLPLSTPRVTIKSS